MPSLACVSVEGQGPSTSDCTVPFSGVDSSADVDLAATVSTSSDLSENCLPEDPRHRYAALKQHAYRNVDAVLKMVKGNAAASKDFKRALDDFFRDLPKKLLSDHGVQPLGSVPFIPPDVVPKSNRRSRASYENVPHGNQQRAAR